MPLMMYDISVAFGASNFFGAALPLARNLCVPLMPGSTRNCGVPVESTRNSSADAPPAGV